MQHTLVATRANLHGRYFASAEPVLTVDAGDVVRFVDVPDVSWGLEPPVSTTQPRRKVEPRDPVRDDGPCLCGPVAVRGAEVGDTLEVGIEEVRPCAWGWTYAGDGLATREHNAALGIGDAPLTLRRWMLDDARRVATDGAGERVKVRAFMGTIGLCPAEEGGNGWWARGCGGNMDCRELIAGTTLYLPVMVNGGMLSLGDGHAAQGDGELSGTAIECAMEEVRVRVGVRKGMRIATPRARTAEGWVTLGFGATLDIAAAQAASAMVDLMVEELGIASRADAVTLASARVSLRVTQMVNPMRGVHAVLAM